MRNLLETAVKAAVQAAVTTTAKASAQTSVLICPGHPKYPKSTTKIDKMNILNIARPYLK